MRIEKIYLENFKIHKNLEIVFDQNKNLIIGENGTGKSTIFHAIIFSLFGKEAFPWIGIRRAEPLIRHLSSSAKVILEVSDGGKKYRIIRIISVGGEGKAVLEEDGKIVASGIDIVNKKIKEILKINNVSKILDVLYIRQGDLGRFISLSGKSEFTEILEDLFDIKMYSNYLNIVQGVIKDLSKELEYLEKERYSLSRDIEEFNKIFGGISKEELDKIFSEYNSIKKRREELYKKYIEAKTLYSSIDSKLISQENYLRGKYKEVEENYRLLNQKISSLKAEKNNLKYDKYSEEFIKKGIEELESLLRNIEEKIKGLDKVDLNIKLNNLKEKINILKEFINLKGIEERYNYLKNNIEVLNNKLIEISNKIENIKKIINILEISKEKSCPVCKKPLSQEEYTSLLNEYKKEIEELNNEKIKFENELNKQKAEFREVERKYSRYIFLSEKISEYKIPLDKLDEEIKRLNEEIDRISENLRLIDEYEIIKGSINYLKAKDIDSAISKLTEELNKLSEEIRDLMKKISSIEIMKENLEKYKKIMEELGFSSLYDLENEVKKLDEKLKNYENFKPELYKIYLEKLERYNNIVEKIKKIRRKINILNNLQIGLTRFIEKLRKNKTIRLSEEFRRYFKRLYRYNDIVDVKIDLKYGRNKEKIFDIVVAKNIDEKIIYKDINEAGLSGGQIKILDLAFRLALASIVNPNFKVLMLDEPTESLDENVRFSLAELLDSLEDYQIILCTHDELFKEKMGGKVIEFKRAT